jgi:hypothetical protein
MSVSRKSSSKPPEYKRFSEFATNTHLDGAKVKLESILDKEIVVHGYKVTDSRFKGEGSDKCLTIQFSYPTSEERFVIFTGSKVITDQLERNADGNMPFLAIIKRVGKYFALT